MKAMSRALGALMVGLVLQGCVKVMHTKPVFDLHSQVQEMMTQAEGHHKRATDFYQNVRKASATPQAAPYPAMKTLLDSLDAAYQPVRTFVQESWVKIRRFQTLAANRSEIHSDWPEWDEALAIHTWYGEKLPGLKKQVEDINAVSQAFNAEANAHGVGSFDTKQDRDSMVKSVDGLRTSAANIRLEIARVRGEIQKHSAATLGLVKHRKISESLQRMEAVLDKLEARVEPLKARLKAYLDTPGLPAVQYRGPGIPRIKAMEQLEQAMEEVRGLIRQYNAEIEIMNQK